jgi:hypothetical protein
MSAPNGNSRTVNIMRWEQGNKTKRKKSTDWLISVYFRLPFCMVKAEGPRYYTDSDGLESPMCRQTCLF